MPLFLRYDSLVPKYNLGTRDSSTEARLVHGAGGPVSADDRPLDGCGQAGIGPIARQPEIGPFGAHPRAKRLRFGRGGEGRAACLVNHAMEDPGVARLGQETRQFPEGEFFEFRRGLVDQVARSADYGGDDVGSPALARTPGIVAALDTIDL